jgi:hypothetical protein
MRKEMGRKWYQSIDLISSYSCVVPTFAEEIKLKMVEKKHRGTENRGRRKDYETCKHCKKG